MAKRPDAAQVRSFIVDRIGDHPRDIARITAEAFGITRQAVVGHLKKLIGEGIIEAEGRTRDRSYRLKAAVFARSLSLAENRDEDQVWRRHMEPQMAGLPPNLLRICHYCFSEMYNNAIDHSEGAWAGISVERTAKAVVMTIEDDGVGIFEKIRARCGLEDHRHAILELAKGKLTTDPSRHTGEGIFFTSRVLDRFVILSGTTGFVHMEAGWDFLDTRLEEEARGTYIEMTIATGTTRTLKEEFDRFATSDTDYSFSRTVVPLSLASYGPESLVSRSQARRVLARFDRFLVVCLDFQGVDSIGQAFADEIFRVFAQEHPEIQLTWLHASEQVEKMIRRALAAGPRTTGPGPAPLPG
jgi:anti-sigma regulatory factor (Ser/Thr protein kinase)